MPRTCTVCRHEKRTEIESALLERQPYRTIAARFGPSKASLIRHREHIPTGLAVAKQAEDVANGDSLLHHIQNLQTRTMGILAAAEEAGDHRTCLMAVHQARENVAFLSKLLTELNTAGHVLPTGEAALHEALRMAAERARARRNERIEEVKAQLRIALRDEVLAELRAKLASRTGT